MSRFSKRTLAILVLGNLLIAFSLPFSLHKLLPALEINSRADFALYFVASTAVVGLIAGVSLSAAHASNRRATSALVGGYADAIGLRDRALDQHTIVSTTHPDGRMKSVNENFVRTFGYDASELLGKTPEMLYVDGDAGPGFEDVLAIAAKGKVWKGEQRLKTKDGNVVCVATTIIPRFDHNGVHTESVSIRTDMTAAQSHAADESRNALIERLPDGVFVYDAETYKIIYVNANGRERLGWTFETMSEKSIFDTFQDFDQGMFRRYLEPLKVGEAKQVTLRVEHKIGPLEILTHFDTGPDGRRSLISVVRDISDRVEADKMKLTSVSTVSHELRTPLTSIKGALRLLESGGVGTMSDKAQHMIAIANRNSDRLLALVNDILVLEKIEDGEMTMALQDVNLHALLEEAAENHASYAEQSSIRFKVHSTDLPAVVQADPDRMMQVLANLMSNAAKFSPTEGTVNLYIQDAGDAWRICVEDHGPGIPEAARKTLFDSFFQVTADARYSRPGTGLGLTISKRIMELHGGSISFNTEIDRGTIFYCDLKKLVSTEVENEAAA